MKDDIPPPRHLLKSTQLRKNFLWPMPIETIGTWMEIAMAGLKSGHLELA